MNGSLFCDSIQWGSIIALLVTHGLVWWNGTTGGQRGRRAAIVYLVAFDWALLSGVTAGRSVAGEGTPFWSWHTLLWAALGVLLLFLPAWLLFRFGLAWAGTRLLPVLPTDREQCEQAGRALLAYAWGFNYSFFGEEDGKVREVVKSVISPRGTLFGPGGPGFVMASSHYAIPLTMGMRDTRVGGQGIIFTGRWEVPRSLVDLRLQARTKAVHALTRDGIPVKVTMTAVFQIDCRRAKGSGLYAFNPQVVFAAVHAQGVAPGEEGEPEQLGWERIVVDRAADLLRAAIAQKLLDRLLEGADESSKPPRETLRTEVRDGLAELMKPHGIQVMAIGLGNIEVEDEAVRTQRAESWKARWERQRLEQEARGEAEAIRLIEEARAEVRRQMIVKITQSFQQLAVTGTRIPAHMIAMRFIDVLEDVTASSPVQELLPETVQEFPTQLRLLVERSISEGSNEATQSSKDAK